jgi:hypothetical protein
MKKPTRKTLVRELDKAFSLYIRARDGHCVTCGSHENLQCGHLFSRVAYSTRWDAMNAYCQCAPCNLETEYDPFMLTEYFLNKFGQDKYEELHAKYRKPVKYSNAELKELLEYWRKKGA